MIGNSGPLLMVLTSNHGLNVFELTRGDVAGLVLRYPIIPYWLLELNRMYSEALAELDQDPKVSLLAGETAELSRQIDTISWSEPFVMSESSELSVIAIGHGGGIVSLWLVNGDRRSSPLVITTPHQTEPSPSTREDSEHVSEEAKHSQSSEETYDASDLAAERFRLVGVISLGLLHELAPNPPTPTKPREVGMNIFTLPSSRSTAPSQVSVASLAVSPASVAGTKFHLAVSFSEGTLASMLINVDTSRGFQHANLQILEVPALNLAEDRVATLLTYVPLAPPPKGPMDTLFGDRGQEECGTLALLALERNKLRATLVQLPTPLATPASSAYLSTPASLVSVCDFPILYVGAKSNEVLSTSRDVVGVSLLLGDSQNRLMHTRLLVKLSDESPVLIAEPVSVLRSYIPSPVSPAPGPIVVASSHDRMWLLLATPVYIAAEAGLPIARAAATLNVQPHSQLRTARGARLTAEAILELNRVLSARALAPAPAVVSLSDSQDLGTIELASRAALLRDTNFITADEEQTQGSQPGTEEVLLSLQESEAAIEFARANATWTAGLTDPSLSKARPFASWALRKENIALALMPVGDSYTFDSDEEKEQFMEEAMTASSSVMGAEPDPTTNSSNRLKVRKLLSRVIDRLVARVPEHALPTFARLPPHDLILTTTFLAALDNLSTHVYSKLISNSPAFTMCISIPALRACLASVLHAQQLAMAQSVTTRFIASYMHTLASPTHTIAISFARAITYSQPVAAVVEPKFVQLFADLVLRPSHPDDAVSGSRSSPSQGTVLTRERAIMLQATLCIAKMFIQFGIDALRTAASGRLTLNSRTSQNSTRRPEVETLASLISQLVGGNADVTVVPTTDDGDEAPASEDAGAEPYPPCDRIRAVTSARNEHDRMLVSLNALNRYCILLTNYITSVSVLNSYLSDPLIVPTDHLSGEDPTCDADPQHRLWNTALHPELICTARLNLPSLALLQSIRLAGSGMRLASGTPASCLYFLVSRLRHVQSPAPESKAIAFVDRLLQQQLLGGLSSLSELHLDHLPYAMRVLALSRLLEQVLWEAVIAPLLSAALSPDSPLRGELIFALAVGYLHRIPRVKAKRILEILESPVPSLAAQPRSEDDPLLQANDVMMRSTCLSRAERAVLSYYEAVSLPESKVALPDLPPLPSPSEYAALVESADPETHQLLLHIEMSTPLLPSSTGLGGASDFASLSNLTPMEFQTRITAKRQAEEAVKDYAIDCQLVVCDSCSWISPRFVTTVCPHCAAWMIAL